ncbi:MAG: glycosyltransferase [Bacillus sp. (in: Bacteria)]|nr:glycosyltransferase [Bacillus sp. (in: firmicutes)]
MKKQLLFVTQYLHTGGIEKSLLTVLAEMDYNKYDVDLLLFDYSGVLFKKIPSQVNILPPLFETFSTPLFQAAPELVKSGQYRLLVGKILAAALAKVSKGVGTGARWAVYRHILQKSKKHYDIAISYIDFFCNYYVTEKVNAEKKIVYNHMDYTYSQINGWPCPKLDKKSFSVSDYIITVAETSKTSLVSIFPEFSNKIHVIHNRVSPETVRSMSEEASEIQEFQYSKFFKVVTVARLVDEKGVMLALEACGILVNLGFDIKWFLVGNGPMNKELEMKSKELKIDNYFILLGERENPYPFMKYCDVYVQPSKTEAHCVAVEEALALYRPIVVTNIPSFQHQIQNEETGILVDTSAEGIAGGIKQLINSNELRTKLTSNLMNSNERNQDELGKLYRLIEA